MDTVDRVRGKLKGLEQLRELTESFARTRRERDRLISRLVNANLATAQEVAETCHISRSRVYQLAQLPMSTDEREGTATQVTDFQPRRSVRSNS
jgi:DNA-directed RNA polymerase specialized sigma subunit